jgi:TPP-dependent 2-oxoacid decarboxylase
MGNAAHKIRTETIGGSVHIVNHGRVSKSEADAAVRSADILVNIGEAKGKQVSSKIFEYMSTGKPIIHLAYVEDDAVSKILEKYPLALCLVQNLLYKDANVRLTEKHITENRSKVLSFEDVKSIYPEALPETTGALLGELVRHHSSNLVRDNCHNSGSTIDE